MAITITTILGTDSLTASRPIINDNFNILKDEINALEQFIDPDAGTLDGLSSLISGELSIGPSSNYLLQINNTTFDINTSVDFTSSSSTVTFNGKIAHDSFATLNSSITGLSLTIDPTGTQYGRRNFSVINTSTSAYSIQVSDGLPGQEITFFCENISGDIDIVPGGSGNFVFGTPGSGSQYANQTVSLNDIGSNVTLRFMTDSSGNGSWYAVAYHNVTFS